MSHLKGNLPDQLLSQQCWKTGTVYFSVIHESKIIWMSLNEMETPVHISLLFGAEIPSNLEH